MDRAELKKISDYFRQQYGTLTWVETQDNRVVIYLPRGYTTRKWFIINNLWAERIMVWTYLLLIVLMLFITYWLDIKEFQRCTIFVPFFTGFAWCYFRTKQYFGVFIIVSCALFLAIKAWYIF